MDETALKDVVLTLHSVHRALNELETKGKQNHAIVVACMNDIEQVIGTLNGKENADGNAHTES